MSLDKYNSTADEYAAAEGLIKRALELDPNDGEVWAVSSQFNTAIRTRGFDHDPARREAARSQAERALKLAPDSIEGLFALARWQRDNDPDPAVAERTFKEVLARAPATKGHSARSALTTSGPAGTRRRSPSSSAWKPIRNGSPWRATLSFWPISAARIFPRRSSASATPSRFRPRPTRSRAWRCFC